MYARETMAPICYLMGKHHSLLFGIAHPHAKDNHIVQHNEKTAIA